MKVKKEFTANEIAQVGRVVENAVRNFDSRTLPIVMEMSRDGKEVQQYPTLMPIDSNEGARFEHIKIEMEGFKVDIRLKEETFIGRDGKKVKVTLPVLPAANQADLLENFSKIIKLSEAIRTAGLLILQTDPTFYNVMNPDVGLICADRLSENFGVSQKIDGYLKTKANQLSNASLQAVIDKYGDEKASSFMLDRYVNIVYSNTATSFAKYAEIIRNSNASMEDIKQVADAGITPVDITARKEFLTPITSPQVTKKDEGDMLGVNIKL